jgi:hypothetical protein
MSIVPKSLKFVRHSSMLQAVALIQQKADGDKNREKPRCGCWLLHLPLLRLLY